MSAFSSDAAKRLAAAEALKLVAPGMRLGLGTGSTARHFVDLLGARVAGGLDVICVPTSEQTRAQAEQLFIPLATIDSVPELDLTVDGADEFDARLRLIKGGGGALLREKIVATASRRMIVIADSSKQVKTLGAFPLPVEVTPFGLEVTCRMIRATAEATGATGSIRPRQTAGGKAFISDNGNYIVDCHFGALPDPDELARRLSAIPGVVEHGLFIGVAKAVISAGPEGVEIFGRLDEAP
ncbi:ribose-5-phosphate isomerase RpiA [Methylocella tundrae]|uniref:Ribose-5-phosphate isomerase A n=1 Tax=Methylocella tundrae TaxID=227605 RepID=A0A4U8YV03_METTU|nr:ribose-5-phosphate isomerase RpiA [Methylocella tundrae]WPP04822.1 ribose-5-phosphate isomerase RpiA [Methylocella tundrae]VFU07065.1 Ribose-5-phosphate isomerase A [Methylocella tundrae]